MSVQLQAPHTTHSWLKAAWLFLKHFARAFFGSPKLLKADVVTTSNLGYTYDNGSSGVGATLTKGSAGAFATTDDVIPFLNMLVLVTAETTAARNGLYKLTRVGSSSVAAQLTRVTDFDASAEMLHGTMFAVTKGTTYGGTTWYYSAASSPTVGTTELAFAQVPSHIDTFDASVQKRTVTITEADLTAAVNGTAQAINIGAVLPANAVVLGHEVNVATLFSGGSASSVKLDIGGTDVDAIVSQMDIFTGAATGALSPRTGVHAQGKFSAEQLVATITPDAGHTLLGLTAGALTVTVWYSVLA